MERIKSFISSDLFNEQITNLKEKRNWKLAMPFDLEFIPIEKLPFMLPVYSEDYGIPLELMAESMNSGILVKLKSTGKVYPVRELALRDFIERAGFTCPISTKLDTTRLIELIDEFLNKMNPSILINETDGIILSALSSGYEIAEEDILLNLLQENLRERFGELIFSEGTISDDMIRTDYYLDEKVSKELLDVYSDKIGKKHLSFSGEDLIPMIRFSTGSTGWKSIEVEPLMCNKKKNVVIPLNCSFTIAHKTNSSNNVSIYDKFTECCKLVYPSFIKNLEDFNKNLDITLEYPAKVAKKIFEKVGIPQRRYSNMVQQIVEDVELLYPNTATAAEILWKVFEITNLAKKFGATERQSLDLEETMQKALQLNLKELDY